MLGLILWASLAQARGYRGHDEFGRVCAVRLGLKISVMVEDEWYDGPAKASQQRIVMTPVRARSGAQDGELELYYAETGPSWFRLTLASATGYTHACRIDL